MTQQGQCFENRLLSAAHPSWHSVLRQALQKMDPCFLECLRCCPDHWLPRPEKCFAAFEKPKQNVRVVWLGESPYLRRASATGLSFQDGRVDKLFCSDGGLSKNVNKATSLRAILKAWFVATGRLDHQKTNKEHIEKDVQERADLHATGTFRARPVPRLAVVECRIESIFGRTTKMDKEAQIDKWKPFVEHVLRSLAQESRVAHVRAYGRLSPSRFRKRVAVM